MLSVFKHLHFAYKFCCMYKKGVWHKGQTFKFPINVSSYYVLQVFFLYFNTLHLNRYKN